MMWMFMVLPRLLRECLTWWMQVVQPWMPPVPWNNAPRVLHDRLPHVPQAYVLR